MSVLLHAPTMAILLLLHLVAIVAVHGRQTDSSVDLLNINIVNTSDYKEREHMADSSTDVLKLRQVLYPQYKVITQEQRRLSMARHDGVSPTAIVHEKDTKDKPTLNDDGNFVGLGNAFSSISADRYGEGFKPDFSSKPNILIQNLPLALSGHDSFSHSAVEEENTFSHKPTSLNVLMPLKHIEGVSTDESFLKEHKSEKVNNDGINEHRYASGYETINPSVDENDDVSVHGPEEGNSVGNGESRYADGYVTRNPSVVVQNNEASEYLPTTNLSPVDSLKGMRLNQNLALALQSTTFPSTLKEKNYNYIGISSEKPVEEQNEESIGKEEPKDYSSSFVTATENEPNNVENYALIPTEGHLFPTNLQQFPIEDNRPLLPTHSTVVDEPLGRHFMIPIQVSHNLHLSQNYPLFVAPEVCHQSILHHVGHYLRHITDPTHEHLHLDREPNIHEIAPDFDSLHRFTPQFNGGLVSDVYSHYESPSPPDTL